MKSLKVEDYMNKRPVTFSVDMNIAEAVERILDIDQSGGPVLDSRGKVVGFLSEQDCITQMIESTYYREQVAKVGDIMATDVKSLRPYSSVLEVAQKMALSRPRIYPVIDDDGHLVGTINRHQVMRAIDTQLHDAYNMV
ncbi:CBS domain-containing membrane protein [Catenovulum agarivorans DS-2]|uniref:CBS domain-containing membrane protein n=1 Tax=Catenovulum agarivorans DS-2 TaxID=1328313 RepID=W7QK94_9ALTE|nr:CBS domain-containing protein [Catenovulum agarivorans]EWH12331.1 CBS domain-containing membrane protein [Catenovulum agarivorans DS-2]